MNKNGREPIPPIKGASGPMDAALEEFRQAAIDWAKASEATRVFLILEPLSAITESVPNPEEYYNRMKDAFDKEEVARKRYFKAVHDFLACQREMKMSPGTDHGGNHDGDGKRP